ncbi:hypothetical protein [Actinokineospora diospyrosa]|uniref:Uncharacterized protein n=1 Tax=Actinokineospora diospyrosa TaxID=103728 RepID=A0ABT1IDZ7_9PSEU|nr:hypothetical protein [Actinokineospora diospyrosa]MCP2270847.1 hypothetical protein [Actinokineospora diospyrosa]
MTVSAVSRRTLGIPVDGTVVAAGRSSEGQTDVRHWREIVSVA